jgi:hypothetical protein
MRRKKLTGRSVSNWSRRSCLICELTACDSSMRVVRMSVIWSVSVRGRSNLNNVRPQHQGVSQPYRILSRRPLRVPSRA